MNTITTGEFIRSATFSAITSATHAFVESLEEELRGRVLSENVDLAESTLEAMIENELPLIEAE